MRHQNPKSDLRDFAVGFKIDVLGRIYSMVTNTVEARHGKRYEFIANNADEFFYQRLWDGMDEWLILSTYGMECRQRLDERIKTLINSRLR